MMGNGTCRCSTCEELLQPYLDRELSDAERREVEAHLAACGWCSKHYRFEERLWRHVKDCCSGEPMREELKERLLLLRTPLL
jgi:anti-sigma factor (TIGR02949 family)